METFCIVILVSLDLDMEFIRRVRGEIPFIAIDVDLGSDLPAVLVDQEQGSLLAGVLSAFSDNGIKVPDEVSVLGFDGLPETEFYNPPLSTIYQNFGKLGEVAVEYLLDVINHPNAEPNRYILKPILVSRESTKALSSKG